MTALPTQADPFPYLWRLLIDHRHQRRGIGQRVVQQLIEQYRSEGYSQLGVSYVIDAPGSPERFYKQFGFEPTGHVQDGEADAILQL